MVVLGIGIGGHRFLVPHMSSIGHLCVLLILHSFSGGQCFDMEFVGENEILLTSIFECCAKYFPVNVSSSRFIPLEAFSVVFSNVFDDNAISYVCLQVARYGIIIHMDLYTAVWIQWDFSFMEKFIEPFGC